jgi:hypothetical protein
MELVELLLEGGGGTALRQAAADIGEDPHSLLIRILQS